MIRNFFGNLPNAVKIVIASVTGGILMLSVVAMVSSGQIVLVVGIGLIFVAFLLCAFYLIWRWLKRLKGKAGVEKLKKLFSHTPRVSADKQAKLNQVREQFLSGIEKFKKAGMNLYSFPWYIIVGESGSGKTEAIRHCNIGFPPGLQDPFQGAGGTLNMDWWFTNEAVIIDTAGRMMFEEVDAGSEWISILKHLRKFRPHEPINGVFLVISADSLIRDSADEIKLKAGKISQRLHEIQNNLDLRFPVYILITKSDLICGFREFFEDVSDPRIQNQILGWSNDSKNLDDPFDPDNVGQNLETVIQKVKQWRIGLLKGDLDEDGRTRVSSYYAFPNQLAELIPRLKLYLEQIFPSGRQLKHAWGQPLFVRGIYFTSSMQEGLVLDKAVAELIGKDLGSVGTGLSTRRKEVSFFLHDLFKLKAFKEDGLVTRATNVKQQRQIRKLAVMSAGIVAVLLLLFQTWYAGDTLKESIGRQHDYWMEASQKSNRYPVGDKSYWRPIVATRYQGGDTFFYDDREPISLDGKKYSTIQFLEKLKSQSDISVEIPKIYQLMHPFKDFRADMKEALRVLYQSSVIMPVTSAARKSLSKKNEDRIWSEERSKALGELIKLETYALPRKKTKNERSLYFDVLLRAITWDKDSNPYDTEKGQVQELFDSIYTAENWESTATRFASENLREREKLRDGFDQFVQYCFTNKMVSQSTAELDRIDKLYKDIEGLFEGKDEPTKILAPLVENLASLKSDEKESIIDVYRGKFPTVGTLEALRSSKWNAAFSGFSAALEGFNEDIAEWAKRIDNIYERSNDIKKRIKEITGIENNLTVVDSYQRGVEYTVGLTKANLKALALPRTEEKYGDEVKDRQNTFIKELNTAFGKSVAEFMEDRLDPEKIEMFERMEVKFTALNNHFQSIKEEQSQVNERYEGYEIANRELDASDSIPEMCDLPGFVETLTSELDALGASIKENPNDPISTNAILVTRELLDLSARIRVSKTIRGILSNIPGGTTEYVKDFAKNLVIDDKIDDLELNEAIPHDIFASEFHPEAAAVTLKCWKSIFNIIQDPNVDPIDKQALSVQYKKLDTDFENYLKQYTKYWLEEAPLAFKKKFKDLGLAQEYRYPSVPFAEMEGQFFATEFHPELAATALDAFHKVVVLVDDQDVSEKLTNQWFKGVTAYFEYWRTKAPEGLNIKELTWSEFQDQFDKLKDWDFHDPIEKFREVTQDSIKAMKSAVEKVYPGELEKRGIKTAEKALREIEQAKDLMEGKGFRAACRNMIRAWTDLPMNDMKAGKQVLEFQSDDTFVQEYLNVYEANPENFVHGYWSALTLRLLQSLSHASEKKAVESVNQLREKCIFPLSRPNVAGRELTKDQVEEISTRISNILYPPSDDTDDKTARRIKKEFPKIYKELERLAGRTLDKADVQRLEATQQIIDVVRQKEFSLSIVKVEEQGENQSGIPIWRAVSIDDQEKQRTQQSKEKVIVELEMPNSPFTFKFYRHPSDEEADRQLTVSSIWGGIRLLHDQLAQSSQDRIGWKNMGGSEDATEWTVAMILSDDVEKEHTILLRLKFERSLPSVDNWPSWD